jgi:hypothetical protein
MIKNFLLNFKNIFSVSQSTGWIQVPIKLKNEKSKIAKNT